MNSTNNIAAREAYKSSLRMFYMAFRDKFPVGAGGDKACKDFVEAFKLTQGEIRLEVGLTTAATSFTFGVTQQQPNTQNVVYNTERRLPLQDSICVTEMALMVCNPNGATGVVHQLRSYGNTVDFPTGAASLNSTFYSHGALQVKINNDVVLPYRGLINFWYKPQTQQTAALGANSPDDQLRGAEDAMVTVEPNLVLIGSKNIVPEIVLPAALAAVDADTRAVLILRGPYAQNSTVVN